MSLCQVGIQKECPKIKRNFLINFNETSSTKFHLNPSNLIVAEMCELAYPLH